MSIYLPFRPGDVVLTSAGGLLGGINKLGQYLIRMGNYPEYTHVAVCVIPDVLLDARPFVHIKLRNIVDEVEQGGLTAKMGENKQLCVLRASRLGNDDWDALDEATIGLALPLIMQLKKKYNWLFTLPNPSDKDSVSKDARRAFCSELCVLMLKELNILPEDWGAPSATLPSNFQDLRDNQEWSNVTKEWCEELCYLERGLRGENKEDRLLIDERKANADRWIKETCGWAEVQKSLDKLSKHIDELNKRSEKLNEQMQQLIQKYQNAKR